MAQFNPGDLSLNAQNQIVYKGQVVNPRSTQVGREDVRAFQFRYMGVDSDNNARDRTASFRVGSPGYAAITGLFEQQRQKEAAAKKAAEEAAKKAVQPPPPPPVMPFPEVRPQPPGGPTPGKSFDPEEPPAKKGVGSFQSAPGYAEFLKSEEYKSTQGKAAAAVIDPVKLGLKTYNFGNPLIGGAYRDFLEKNPRFGYRVTSRGPEGERVFEAFDTGFLDRPEPERPRYPGFEEDQPLTESMKKFIAEGKRIDGRKRGDDFLKTLDISIVMMRGGMGEHLNAKTSDGIPVLLTSAQKERLAKLKGADSALGNLLGSKTKLKTDAELFSAATGNEEMTAIDSDTSLLEEMGKQAGGDSTPPKVTDTLIPDPTVSGGDKLKQKDDYLADKQKADTSIVDTSDDDLDVTVPSKPKKGVGQIGGIDSVASDVRKEGVDVAQIDRDIRVDFEEGRLSEGAMAEAAVADLDERATTQYQLTELLGSIEEGKPLPPWASPAARKISGIMQSRGLGASSMAAAAMTQAVMESGVVIATQDANKYAAIQLQNLNNRQRTALQNSAVIASMDKENLSARLKAAVTNAQLLLATETKNMDAQQQSNVLEYNALIQGMFKDSAQENARKQFNAKNELQVEEFFAELESQVETANANRLAAIEQFNAGQENAQNQFNASMRDSRSKFNANMKFAIDQSNVQWRREINTANTAIQNENNRINVQNELNVSQSALNNLWQMYRDNAAWNFQKSESMIQRQHEVGIMAMEFANTKEMYSQEQKDNLALGIGNWVALWAAGTGKKKDDT